MPTNRTNALSLGTTFIERLSSLTFAMLDHLDGADQPPAQYHMAPGTTHFSTYAEARRTVLSEYCAPRSYIHQMLMLDYSTELQWNVADGVSFLESVGDGSSSSEGYAGEVAVKKRWPYRVPDDEQGAVGDRVSGDVNCDTWRWDHGIGPAEGQTWG